MFRTRIRRLMLLGIMSTSILIGISGCDVASTNESDNDHPSAADDPKSHAAETDKRCAEAIKGKDKAEAREWCSPDAQNHVGWKVSKAEMLKMTNALYDRGARMVWVVGISEMGQNQVAAMLVVVLPQDAESRKKLFEYDANWRKEIEDEEKNPDVGQKYLEYNLDM